MDILEDLAQELRTSLQITQTHLSTPGKTPEERAELRGRLNAYRIVDDQVRRAICQIYRRGHPNNLDAVREHVEIAQILVAEIEVEGYKSVYAKGVFVDKLVQCERCVISLENCIG